MEPKIGFSLDAKIALALFVVVFVVYLLTLCPTIYPGPSANAVCDVGGVGLAPPTGHPIWLILGRLFGHLSSNTAYVLNLMSAFFGALTIALLYAVLSQLSHTRTAEEEARYQTHPYLRQVAALSGVLLVAFSHPFWEGCVLAGSDTLDTFFLVIIVFILARYVKTSKSRYAMVFALLYGLAITNYPTLFLLAPLFVIFLLLRCRALLDDPVTVVLMFVLFGLGLLPALYGPRAYLLQGKDYVVHAKTFGMALSVFMGTYFRSMQNLFLQKNSLHDWLFWLFLPTFVPMLFFLMRKGDYERGSPMATKMTYLVRHAFVFLFVIGGLGYLWGFRVGPVGMAGLDALRYSRYLGSYVVVGGWFSYIVGYWIIVATGKFKATGTEPEPKVKYSKIGYIAAVVVALALPVLGFVMHYSESTKRGAKHTEHLAMGMLKSSPHKAIIIVPAEPYYGSIGAPLRYFQSQHSDSSLGQEKIIVDLNAAYFDFYRDKRLEISRYLAETVFGRKVSRPRDYFVPEHPFARAYDAILRCETLRAREKGERARPICGLRNNFFLSALVIGNDGMNRDYEPQPLGLLHVYRSRLEYRDRAAVIKHNESLWKELTRTTGISERVPEPDRRSEVEEYIFNEFSKSANDFGVYCHLTGRMDLAEKYYKLALTFSPENSSALRNMACVMTIKGNEARAEEFNEKYMTLVKKREEQKIDFMRTYGVAIDFPRLVGTEAAIADEGGPAAESRRLGILHLAAKMMPQNPTVRERTGAVLLSSEEIFSVQEARVEYLAALERTDPNDKQAMKRILRELGRLCTRLGKNPEAEEFFKDALALEPDSPSAQLDLMQFYLATEQKTPEVERLAKGILERVPAGEEEKEKLSPAKKAAAMIMARVLLESDGVEKAREFLEQYLTEDPQQAEVLLTLAPQLRSDPALDPLTIWLVEKHVQLMKDLPPAWVPQLAELYVRQKRYDAVIEMKEPVAAGPNMDAASFHYFKGRTFELLGKIAEAKESYEQARSLLPEQSGGLGVVLANNLSWLYFKDGEHEKARDVVQEAVAKDPANSLIWDTYGWILYKTAGDFERASELIERSHLVNPDVGIVSYHYAKLLIEKGLKDKGMTVLKRAVASGIEDKEELEDARRILKEWQEKSGGAGAES